MLTSYITNRRGTWSEVKVAGAKPRARCCTALFALEQRVLMFGGDTYGACAAGDLAAVPPVLLSTGLCRDVVLLAWHAHFQKAAPHPTHCHPHCHPLPPTATPSAGVTNELWSLRGLEGEGPAQWTQLQLEGPAPAPRRGHAVAGAGRSSWPGRWAGSCAWHVWPDSVLSICGWVCTAPSAVQCRALTCHASAPCPPLFSALSCGPFGSLQGRAALGYQSTHACPLPTNPLFPIAL